MNQANVDFFAEIGARSNPFPGLRPFEVDESHLFFGRSGQSQQLIAKLSATRFLAVVGTSGSGKSSLARAGLLPALYGGFMTGAGSAWRVAIMRPGADAIGNLARALNHTEVFGSEDPENNALQVAITEATLRRGGLGLVEAVRQANMPATENLLVVVDQFEEIFRVEQGRRDEGYENDKAAFIKLLLGAKNQTETPIYVALTMRSDYMGDCAQFWDLPEAINEGQYLIPRLTREQRRAAITGPVAVAGGEITPRLVNRLLNDVGDNPDQLPILQHALMRTWDEWANKIPAHNAVHEGEAIDLCCYEAIGGMAQALSRHADEAFGEVGGEMGARGQQIA
jgi:energy-coupling factor transporter ATP-binding protein EcfA2